MSDAGYVVVLDVGGESERFDSVRVALTERVGFFDAQPSARSVSLAVTPRVLDLPAIVAAGADPTDVLVRIYDGDDLVFTGRATGSVRWGRAGTALRLTATESPWADESRIPASWTQRITVVDQAVLAAVQSAPIAGVPMQVWGLYEVDDLRGDPRQPPIVGALGYSLFTDRAEGRAGPIVFGSPGSQDGTSWPATPAYWVDTTEGAERLLVARHACAATQATIYGPCVDGEVRGKLATLTRTRDALGVEITVAELDTLLGRAPILTLTYAAIDNATTYALAGTIRRVGAASAPLTTWPGYSLSPSADTFAALLASVTTTLFPGDSSQHDWTGYATLTSEQTALDAGTIEIRFLGRYELAVTTDTATGGTGTQLAAVSYEGGANVASPTDFAPDLEAEWGVAWTHGEALPGGAGDVIRWVLDQTRIRVDRYGIDSWRRYLNGFTLAGCIDEEVEAADWLAAQLAWLPISWIQGRDGLRLWVYDPDAQPVARLDEDEGLHLLGDAATTEPSPVARVELRYRVGEDRGDGRLVTSQSTVFSEDARRGRVEQLETDLVDASATAERAAAFRQRLLSARHLVVRGQLARESWAWLRAGDPVDVIAPSLGVTGRGWLLEITDDRGPWLEVEAAVLRTVERWPSERVDPPPVPPPPPEHTAGITAHWTVWPYWYGEPVGTQSGGNWLSIYNRGDEGGVDNLLASNTPAVEGGYLPGGDVEIAVCAVTDRFDAWLHPPVVSVLDAPWSAHRGGYLVSVQTLRSARSNEQDLAVLQRGGRGTGGSASNCIIVETATGVGSVVVRVRAFDSPGSVETVATVDIPDAITDGTGSYNAWICVGVWWEDTAASPRAWRVRVIYDLDDGNGPITLDETFSESVSDLNLASKITKFVVVSPGVFGQALYKYNGTQDDMVQDMRAAVYALGVTL